MRNHIPSGERRKYAKSSGFTLVEIMIVVAIIGLLAAIAVSNFIRARETSQLNVIMSNLRTVEGAKEQWALEARKGTGDTPTESNLTPFLKNNSMPTLVVGETYNLNVIGSGATAVLPANISLGSIAKGGTVTIP